MAKEASRIPPRQVFRPMMDRLQAWLAPAGVVLLGFYVLSSSIALFLRGRFGVPWASYIDEVALAGFLALVIAGVASRRAFPLTRAYAFIAVFLLFGVASSLLNHVELKIGLLGLLQAIKPVVIFGAMFSVVSDRASGRKSLIWLDRLMVGLVILGAAYAVLFEWVLGFNPAPAVADMNMTPRLGITPLRSFFPHPGTLANVMVLATLYHFAQWLLNDRRAGRGGLSLMAGGLVYATVRMKAVFALPFLVLVTYLLVKWTREGLGPKQIRRAGLIAGGAVLNLGVLAVLLMGLWLPRVAKAPAALSSAAAPSPSVRRALLDGAVAINLAHHGLGAGFGMFGSPASTTFQYSPLYDRYGISSLQGATPDYTSYLTGQWWAWFLGEAGLWGTLAFLGFLISIGWGLVRRMRQWREAPSEWMAMSATALGALVYGVGTGFASSFLSGPPSSYLTFGLLGIAYALARGMERRPQNESRI